MPIKNKTVTAALIVAVVSLFYAEISQADAPKSYSRSPMGVNASQIDDALLGSDKYEKPVWNLHDTLQLPEWLSMSVEQRTRYETLDGGFKAGVKGGDQQIALQTDLWLEAKLDAFRFGAEFMDSRAEGADSGSGVNNGQADTADFIQAYLAWADKNAFSGIGAEVKVGRQTLDFGSRRLIARPVYRNTSNSFTGLRARFLDYGKWQFNAFFTMPVNRFPLAANAILNDTQQFDQEATRTWLSGGFLDLYNLGLGINGELYLYHLDEGDSFNNPTRKRRFFTPGGRFYIKPSKAHFDFQAELIGQFGTVRATTTSTKDLTHEAWSEHVDAGYSFDAPWSPRFAMEYDYASGDKNPSDNKDQRFDQLYGTPVPDFGPTGIYGAFSRSNINSPGYKLQLTPRPDVLLTLQQRLIWLASANDCWGMSACTGNSLYLQPNKKGTSGSFVGDQLGITARYDFNSSLNFETGWFRLFKGQFAKQALNAPSAQDVDYFYVQSMLRF